METLNILSWNVRSLTNAKLYLNKLIDVHKIDIICLSEHRLFEHELYKLGDINANYNYVGKSSDDLKSLSPADRRGHCGVAVLWHKSLAHCI